MNIVNNVVRKINVLVFGTLFLLATANAAICCDNTLLELLTGSTPEASISARLLVISSKMQVTAGYARAFNNAAADKMHHEVMESWLYVASQITSNPPGQAAGDPDFHAVIVQISRDLGSIRQKILQRQLDDVHDQLEVCVSRMSLLAAIINGHQRMRDFLRFELLVLTLRPCSRLFESRKVAIISSDFILVLTSLDLPESLQVIEKIASLKSLYQTLSDRTYADQNCFNAVTQTAYLALYNEFSVLKKLLVAEKYFNLK
ncbi:MAG: hypothetical protein KKB51_10370 [Candidatus Riflebacteria bacterium]|nr:hypothetical protein [Candidatus Riflebacteria bacterium]